MEEKGQSSFIKFLGFFFVGALLVLVTSLVTLYITKTLHPQQICGTVSSGDTETKLTFGDDEKWEAVENYEIPGKAVTVSRTVDKCFISPTMKKRNDGKTEPLEPVPDALSEPMIEALGGHAAVEICRGLPTYMLKVIIPAELKLGERLRTRRQAVRENPDQDVNKYDESKNENRCMHQIIICADSVGQKSSCWTGINGIFWMERICKSPTQFVIEMTKPPGRLIKIIRNEWVICQKRRRMGLSVC